MKRILLFSSVRKPKQILEISLYSYVNLKQEGFALDFLFYDDADNPKDSAFLTEFCQANNCRLLPKIALPSGDYNHHNWNVSRIDRIIEIKNQAIQYALQEGYDYLFLVDSDLVLHPMTLSHLVSQKEHFIFEVFWTLFFRQTFHKPNAWDHHSWGYTGPETILKLSKKGKYVVGGGGACTLLTKEILSKNANFDRLPSLSYQGEDRHFCTRAQALGYNVVVDTHYPAYHIFLENQCQEAKEWYTNGCNPDFFNTWLDAVWKKRVEQSFEELPKEGFFRKVKRFQYEVRQLFLKTFWKK